MKRIAILQSNYIPWKGYFDLINMVDEFILFDDVQYTKNDWRNRNKIKTRSGVSWLTIPVEKNNLTQLIKDTKVSSPIWQKKHWKTISQNYSKSKYFNDYKDLFEDLYLNTHENYLSEINYKFIKAICNMLDIETKIRFSNEFTLEKGKTKRLLEICKQCNANTYLSGASAKSYFDLNLAAKENIKIEWMDYSYSKEYKQLFAPFEHEVSIIDLIFNMGKDAKKYMMSFQ